MTDVVFGDTSPSASAIGGFASGYQFASKHTLTGGDPAAVLKDIAIDMSATGSHTADYTAAVWRDSAGSPGALVGYGFMNAPAGAFSEQFLSVLGQGGSITLVDAGGVMADGDYWIGAWQSAGSAYNFQYLATSLSYKSVGGSAPTNPFGSEDGFVSFHMVANATVTFAAGCNPPENDGGTMSPEITGTAEVGETLTVDAGFWTGDATITFTYQWLRLCGTVVEEIVGETATTYDVTMDDVDCNILCEVTATNGCAPDGVADSNELGPVPDPPIAPVNVTPPVVTGIAQPGHSLETTDGTWTGSPSSFAYQWEINCGTMWEELAGETTDTLLLDDSMIDCLIRCIVTASNAEGDTPQASNEVTVQENVPAAVEICEGPLWRFVVTDLDCSPITWLDRLARNRNVTYVLNGPSVATMTAPSDDPRVNIIELDGDPYVAEGNRLLFGFRYEPQSPGISAWIVRFAGIIQQLEDSAQQDNSDTPLTAFDPWQYLRQRPVRNGTDLSYTLPGINGSSYTDTRIDVIAGEILRNTIVTDGPVFIDAGPLYGGTGYWDGVIEACDQIDINFAQGMQVGDAWDELVSTNEADFVLTPIYDPIRRPGYTHELSIFTQAGSVVDNAIFGWDKVPRNLIGISRLIEGSSRANTIKFFAGTGGTAVGGQAIPVQEDAASIAKYGTYYGQTFFPGQNVPAAVLALAIAQLELRKNGRRTVQISPSPDCATSIFQSFGLGDRVPVYASDRLREELSGYQRIYGFTIGIADDATETIERMLASKEGFS